MAETNSDNAPQNVKRLFAAVPLDLIPRLVALKKTDAARVYLALAARADFDSCECFPSVSKIAEDIGTHPDTVRRAIKDLEVIGALKVIRRPKEDGRPDSNLYVVNLIPALARDTRMGASTSTRAGASMDTRMGARGIPAPAREELPPQEQPPVERPKGRGSAAVPDSLPQILDTADFRQALDSWLAYKGRKYKPAGLTLLIKQAECRAAEHGTAAVIAAMQRAAANGWAGWDQDSSFSQGGTKHGKHQTGNGQRHDPKQPVKW